MTPDSGEAHRSCLRPYVLTLEGLCCPLSSFPDRGSGTHALMSGGHCSAQTVLMEQVLLTVA